MKKRKRAYVTALLIVCLSTLILPSSRAKASQATSYTYTVDEKGYFARTQDAYLPDKTITSLGLLNPDDLFIDENNILYIADSGNRRIVKYNISLGESADDLTYEGFLSPKGVFVTKNGDIYVADPGAKAVFRFTKDFELVETFTKPSTPSFADTKFEPIRVAVDNGGNLYIIGEGVYSGVIQLAHTGEFLGYFTVNKTKLSISQYIQNLLFTRDQLANLSDRVPSTFSNVFVDKSGIVYTTSMGSLFDGLKKHNTSGGNMFKDSVFSKKSPTDVYVDEQGIIYTTQTRGYIQVYSPQGKLVFQFGSYVSDLDIAGLYSKLPSLAVDKNRNIWTIDGDKGYVQSFQPTDYALMVYSAMGLYEKGLYQESLTKWNEVLRLNQMSILAHDGVGKAYLRAGEYELAMEHFKVAGNRDYYSEAFWEVRNTWIQKYLVYFAILIVVLIFVLQGIKIFDKKKRIKKARQAFGKKLMEVPILCDVLYAFKIPKHPIDLYYNIRAGRKGSIIGATIIYALFFVVFIIYKTGKGFIYQFVAVEDMDINALVVGFFAILGLFVICNYLVTSIKDGDGSFKQVYMIPAYGAVPAIIAMICITILSYGMTKNEAFILSIILAIGIVWSIVNIFLGLLTVHDYSAKENVGSLIITAIFMIIAAVIVILIIIMWEKLWQFILSIGKEAAQNVIN